MKITQGQYFEIEEFFTEKCRLVETEFIEEMVDHFTDEIEDKMTDGVSFNNALDITVEDFGGLKSIRKMQWEFQKALMKKQIREWWLLCNEYLQRPKLYKAVVISIVVTALTFYVCLFTSGKGMNRENFLSGFITGSIIVPIISVIAYFIQLHFGWLRSLGLLKAQNMASAGIRFLLSIVSLLIFIGITELVTILILKVLLLSILWSVLAVLYLVTLVYSEKINVDSWYETR